MIQISRLIPDDISSVIEVFEKCNISYSSIWGELEDFLICSSNNLKCGCGHIKVYSNYAVIKWLLIKPEFRRKGLGTSLAKALLNIADLKKAEKVFIRCNEEDFLSKLGFIKVKETSITNHIKESLLNLYNISVLNNIYMVNLKGYFKGSCK